MPLKTFLTVSDTNGNPVRLNLQHVSTVQKQGKNGVLVIMVDGEKVYLTAEEAAKLAPYLAAMTSTQPPMITK